MSGRRDANPYKSEEMRTQAGQQCAPQSHTAMHEDAIISIIDKQSRVRFRQKKKSGAEFTKLLFRKYVTPLVSTPR